MNQESFPIQAQSGNATIRFINVLMHGAFSYVFDSDCIRAYTPACFGHQYTAGTRDMMKNPQLCQRIDYSLKGVKTAGKSTISPDKTCNPVVSLGDICVDRSSIDIWHNRYTMIELPYPVPREAGNRPQLMHSAINAYVGEIYSGPLAAKSLNSMKMCPSMHIFVYELEESENCQLEPISGVAPPIVASEVCQKAPDTLNLHIFCTQPPTITLDKMVAMGMTPEGHIRRVFASVVDLIGGMELHINFPNGFDPKEPEGAAIPQLPVGVEQQELEPGGTMGVLFGKVNCEYTDLMFVP